jgi:poly-gamma-glutamate synthesis protein (capsule biosynthesis protein)
MQKLLAIVLALGLVLGMAAIAEAKNATRLTMSRRTLIMDWGTRFTLSVSVTPSNASDRGAISWVSDNPLVQVTPDASTPRKATVAVALQEDGVPYPTVPVVVTASTPGGITATCRITLKQIGVKSISVSPSAKTVYLTKSDPTHTMQTPTFYLAGTPVTGVPLPCVWSTNNKNVADVDPDTGLVTFTGEGTARITATYAPGISDYCVFTVKPIRVKSVAIKKGGNPADVLYFDEDDKFTLSAALTSAVGGKRPSYDKVQWKSSDSSVVEVGDSDGDDCQFTCGASGKATITATTDTGRYVKSATCTVYVRDTNPTTLTITAGGDCVLGGDPRTTGITARSTQREYEKIAANPGYPFEKISALFNDRGGSTNLSIVNVEVCLTTKGGSNPSTTRKFLFRGNPKNAAALNAGAGIDIANIANNHTSDFGTASFGNTANSIKSNSSAMPSGYNRYNGALYLPVKTVGDKKVGFYGVQANQIPLSVLSARIKKIKEDSHLDMLVVTIHWTGQKENVSQVTSTMKSYARGAINAGADLVIGHHRHVISGIEKYKGKYILYDLGNFATGGVGCQSTYAVQIDFKVSSGFAETASDGGTDQIRIYPLSTTSRARYVWNAKKKDYSTKQPNNWQPAPAEDAIHHTDRDSGEDVKDTTVTGEVIRIINTYSPVGPDGSKFTAGPYISSLPG